MAEPTDLTIQAGIPYTRRIRITDGKNLWASLDDFEVRSQVRAGRQVTSKLKVNLTPHLTPGFDGNDIVIDLAFTGAETRTLVGGYYDMIVSDVGATDELGLRVLYGQIKVNDAITDAADE